MTIKSDVLFNVITEMQQYWSTMLLQQMANVQKDCSMFILRYILFQWKRGKSWRSIIKWLYVGLFVQRQISKIVGFQDKTFHTPKFRSVEFLPINIFNKKFSADLRMCPLNASISMRLLILIGPGKASHHNPTLCSWIKCPLATTLPWFGQPTIQLMARPTRFRFSHKPVTYSAATRILQPILIC